MKKVLLFFVLNCVFFTSIKCQTYQPLINENLFWDTKAGNSQSWCLYDYGNRYFFEGDTIINSVQYKILKAHPYVLQSGPPPCPPFAVDTTVSGIVQFMREDTITKQVFILDKYTFGVDSALLFFDFSLQSGDTLYSPYHDHDSIVIDSVTYITLPNGSIRKNWSLRNGFSCIEGIGSTAGFYQPFIIGLGWWNELNCVDSSGTLLWGDITPWGSPCTPILSIEKMPVENNISIYPIPTRNYLIIERESEGEEVLQIFDVSGKVLFSRILYSKKEEINLPNFKPGLYFYSLNKRKFGKLVVVE